MVGGGMHSPIHWLGRGGTRGSSATSLASTSPSVVESNTHPTCSHSMRTAGRWASPLPSPTSPTGPLRPTHTLPSPHLLQVVEVLQGGALPQVDAVGNVLRQQEGGHQVVDVTRLACTWSWRDQTCQGAVQLVSSSGWWRTGGRCCLPLLCQAPQCRTQKAIHSELLCQAYAFSGCASYRSRRGEWQDWQADY